MQTESTVFKQYAASLDCEYSSHVYALYHSLWKLLFAAPWMILVNVCKFGLGGSLTSESGYIEEWDILFFNS